MTMENEQAPDDGIYTSQRGVPVRVQRVLTPDSPTGAQTLEIRYGDSGRPGTIVWFPDVVRCWDKAQQIIDHYRNDCDNLGRPFSAKPREGRSQTHQGEDRQVESRKSPTPSTPSYAPQIGT